MGDTDHLRQVAISHICHGDNGGGVLTILSDGTKRSTLATATYGMHRPFSLPTNIEVLEELRRRVADLFVVFQQALDRIIPSTNNQSTLMTNAKTHQSYNSITQITSKATHLEHFHHYQAPPTTNKQQPEEAAEDVHDTGIKILLTRPFPNYKSESQGTNFSNEKGRCHLLARLYTKWCHS